MSAPWIQSGGGLESIKNLRVKFTAEPYPRLIASLLTNNTTVRATTTGVACAG